MHAVALQGVPQTLLLPLMARAWLSQQKVAKFTDQRAIDLAAKLDYNFAGLAKTYGTLRCLWWLGRAYQCDQFIKPYLVKHPKTVVIDLGCGLETSFYRVDNGELTWVDIDLPEVISLKERLLPKPDRVHYLGQSIFDYSWIEYVKTLGDNFIFISAGVLIYFDNDTVQSLLKQIDKSFPNSAIIFDFLSSRRRKVANWTLAKAKMSNAKITWSIDSKEHLLDLLPQNATVETLHHFKNMMSLLNISLWQKLHLWLYRRFYNSGMAIVKFCGNAATR